MILKRTIIGLGALSFVISLSCDSSNPASPSGTETNGAKHYVYNKDNSIMTTNWVYSSAVEADGTVWITTQGGGVYQKKGNQWTQFTVENTSGGLTENSVTEVLIDKQNTKWFGTNNYGVCTFRNGVWDNKSAGIIGNNVLCIEMDSSGNIWAGTGDGAAMYNGNGWTNYSYNDSELPEGEVRAITVGSDGSVYFGIYSVLNDGGIAKLNGNTWTIYNRFNSPINNKTFGLYAINNGTLWAAGDTGVSFFNGTSWILYDSSKVNNAVITAGLQSVATIAQAADGIMCFGGFGGLYTFDGNQWYQYSEYNDGLPYTGTIDHIHIDNKGNKWLSTMSNGLFVYNKSGVK